MLPAVIRENQMKFKLTDEQTYIQRAVREFTKGEFDDDRILELVEKREFPLQLLKKAARLDFIGVCFPEHFGGQDCGLMEQVLIIEEFCRKDSSVGIALSTADAGAEIIWAFGDEDQKKRFLPALAGGKAVSAVFFSDADAGDDCPSEAVLSLSETGSWWLNGEAPYICNALQAEVIVVQARIDTKDSASREETAFALLDREAPGVVVESMGEKLGIDMVSWYRVRFTDVPVTEAGIVRPTPGDRSGAMGFQKIHIVRTAAVYLGIAQGALDMALAYAKQRVQFNRRIAEFQGIRHKLADMYIDLQAARALVYAVVEAYDRGQKDLHDLLATKLTAEKAALFITDEALQIFGGSGYMIELPVEHFYRDVRTLQALAGRKSFQKDVIARAVIGKMPGVDQG